MGCPLQFWSSNFIAPVLSRISWGLRHSVCKPLPYFGYITHLAFQTQSQILPGGVGGGEGGFDHVLILEASGRVMGR